MQEGLIMRAEGGINVLDLLTALMFISHKTFETY